MNDLPRHSNPYSTRFIRPGAIPYLFPGGETPATVIARLRRAAWRGQILGNHGSGKTTLLASLQPALQQAGRRVSEVSLHGGQNHLRPEVLSAARLDGSSILVIDGYEQLSRSSRHRAMRACRAAGSGLLVTAHANVGLPTVYHATVRVDCAVQIALGLLGEGDQSVTNDDVLACFAAHHGNMREALFALYDVYEANRSASTQ